MNKVVSFEQVLHEIRGYAKEATEGRLASDEALRFILALTESGTRAAREEHAAGTQGAPTMQQSDAQVLRKIISTIPYYVFWKDFDSVYLGCNEVLAKIAGLEKPEDIVGRDDFMLPWKREEAEYFRLVDRRVMDSGVAELNIEEPQLQADGKQRVLLTSKVPLRDGAGKVIGILGIFTDITERKELEEQLRRAKEAAEASTRAKSDFLAMMSHELRTPLTLIMSPLESLLNERVDELSPQMVPVLESIRRNAARLRILTEDILDFSRWETGHLRLNLQAIDLGQYVHQFVLDLCVVADARQIELAVDALDEHLGTVVLDVAKFDKILINLVGNALKFTPARGRIGVSLVLDGDSFVLSVRDTGIGIERSDWDRLFLPFEQVDGSTTRRHGGTGLGLSVVKMLTEFLGGSVEVESVLGEGSTFTVRLPHQPARGVAQRIGRDVVDVTGRALFLDSFERPEPSQSPGVAQQEGRGRVLVAEDNPDLRRYLAELLSGEFEVIAVEDGLAAYDAVQESAPDVVLSDVMMPRMDGFELVQRLKADAAFKTIPILLLTARAGPEAVADSLNRGADDYIVKPFSPLDLVARVRVAYRTRSLHQSLMKAERRAAALKEKQALQATQEALAELSRTASLGEMAAAIAHELNQPLAAIGLNASSCLRWMRDEQMNTAEARLAAERVARDVKRAGDVVRRIRELFTQTTPRFFVLDLNDAIREVLVLTEPRLQEAQARLCTVLDEGLPLVQGDRVQLQQVLVNLLVNAAEAMKEPGCVIRELVLRTTFDGTRVIVEVSDTGPGVSEGDREHIFRAFHSTKAQGMGMGLSISKTIVENHGGTLGFRPNAGPGCTFHFALPPSDGCP